MYLPANSIKSVFDAVPIPAGNPIRVVGTQAQRAFLNSMCQEIKDTNRDCSAQVTPPGRGTCYLTLGIEVNTQQSRGSSWNSVRLQMEFKDDLLIVGTGFSQDPRTPVVNIDQIWQIVERLRKKMQERLAREQRKKKITDLKTRSIEAQIEVLAARMHFAYRLERKHTKVVLVVQLDKRQCLFVDIPLGKLQETIDRLESLIGQVNDLYREGLRFKIGMTPYGEFRQPKPVE